MRVDKDWIPRGKGYSLYIRPTCIATDVFLGVHPSKTCKVYTICSPSGPYYATGFKPIKLVADEDHVRAWPGGHGAYKLGANYAPTILPAHEWEKKGYSQLLGIGPNGMIMEGGAMNIFFFWVNEQGEKELITCPLNGLILPGITRKSILQLARKWNEFKVSERVFTIHEIEKAAAEHRLLECLRLHQRYSVQGQDDRHPARPQGPQQARRSRHPARVRRAHGHPAGRVSQPLP